MFTRRSISSLIAGIGMAGLITGCMDFQEAPELADNQTELTWEEFRSMIHHEVADDGTDIFVVNGDEVVIGEKALIDFYEQFVTAGSLIVHQSGGNDAKWSDSQKMNLTYCVASSGSGSFGSNHSTVVSAMNQATASWEAAAQNNINFIHDSSQDSNCTASNNNVVFDVRQTTTTSYLARAFFPDQSRSTRNVLVSTSALPNGSGVWSLHGILEHELGHALGFRHEHTRPEAGTCFEDNNWRALTTYDSASVMHYPHCNGSQTGDLSITSADAAGTMALYGGGTPPPPPPADSCEGFCGGQSADGCWCDSSCQTYGDCCSDYDPVCTGGGCTPYSNNTSNISGSTGNQKSYTLTVPACASETTISIAGGTGDADLYVKFGSAPTTTSYDCRPYKYGNTETCTFSPSQAGTYHIMIRAYSSYSGVTLTRSYN